MPAVAVIALVAGGLVVAAAVVAALAWRVPGADEALVVTGWRPRVVQRRGSLVWPRLQRSCRVDTALHRLGADVDVIAAEGIGFVVSVVGAWRVPNDERSIADAARHFARQPHLAERQIHGSIAARLRATVGAAPAAALLDGGAAADLAASTAAGVSTDIGPLGLVVVALEVTAIGDPTGYLADLARPLLAQASSAARIAVAGADALAVEAEQRAVLSRDRARRDVEVAGVADRRRAPMAGPPT